MPRAEERSTGDPAFMPLAPRNAAAARRESTLIASEALMFNKIVVAVLGLWLSAAACATTYTYTGLPYNTATASYTTSMFITGNFTTASPLPASMPITDIGPNGTNLVTSWSFQ